MPFVIAVTSDIRGKVALPIKWRRIFHSEQQIGKEKWNWVRIKIVCVAWAECCFSTISESNTNIVGISLKKMLFLNWNE